MGILDALFGGSSSSSSSMSDSELSRKLERSRGRNTGEDIATRASQIREGYKRGILTNDDDE